MAEMGCKQFLNHLDAWLEGERSPGAQAHLHGCARCREVAGDLGSIATAARAMTTDEEPPARVWTSLRAQLEREGLIRAARPAGAGGWMATWRGWFAALPRPALAGAYLAILIAAAVALSGPASRRLNDYRWFHGMQATTSPLGAHLNSVEQTTLASIVDSNPVVSSVLHKNLAIVDNYIALCEKSVREEPQNEVARDYLYEAYQQKADLLAQMTQRGEYNP
ncbi:MAG TPA: hypothetical protein VLY23_05105 [Candidatus Acidoferrum sp.]|nr:hypothetical protein [Candidatus Acidoferrum sp.]